MSIGNHADFFAGGLARNWDFIPDNSLPGGGCYVNQYYTTAPCANCESLSFSLYVVKGAGEGCVCACDADAGGSSDVATVLMDAGKTLEA